MPLKEYLDMGHESFFKDEEGVIETFEFDYDLSTKFHQDAMECLFWMIPWPFWFALPYFYCCEKANIRDRIFAQHLAVTRDGIKYVVDTHDAGCRCDCARKGRVSKTVPFDKITDCDIEEPAGAAVCCFVQNVLSTVNVDTASSGGRQDPNGVGKHELTIAGLKDPKKFKALVWEMKRKQGSQQGISEVSTLRNFEAISSVDNNVMNRGLDNSKAIEILSSIDKRMAEQNELLRQIANK